LGKGILCRSYTKGKRGRPNIQRSQSNLRCTAREVLGPLPFLVYVNDIWRNFDSYIRLFADDCLIYRKITNKNDIEKLQKDLDILGGMGIRKWDVNKSR
jgi:hypothetical protein